jgi:hypothetical protein
VPERETTARVRRSTVRKLTISTPYVRKGGITLGLARDLVEAAIEAGVDPTEPIWIYRGSPHDATAEWLEIRASTEEVDRG